MNAAAPRKINIKAGSGVVELSYGEQDQAELGNSEQCYALSFEFLRVHSPSAEVRGHGQGSEVLQYGKKRVTITNIEPVGNYAIKLVFSDGHDSGLYTWPLLQNFCLNQASLWQQYLAKLEEAGKSRDA